MCGLGSITMSADASLSVEKLEAGVSKLLVALDHRGGDACGMMAVGLDGQVVAQSAPCKAKEFNEGRYQLTRSTRAVAVHTRMATKGKPWWNMNNHPVLGPNGALVMHNGVVADSWLKRKAGDPEVDTFALASLVGKVAKRPKNIGDQRFAERLVRAASDAEGSQTLQIAVQGEAMLVSACVRTNPLFMAESLDGSIRVSASTYEAVKQTFIAMGVEIPFEEKEVTYHKKGKKVTSVGRSDVIYRLNDGDVLGWHAGVHAESHLELRAPTRKKYTSTTPSQAAKPYQYSGGNSWKDNRYTVGDIVRRLSDQKLYLVIGIDRHNGNISYRCECGDGVKNLSVITLNEQALTLRQKTRSGMTLQDDRRQYQLVVENDGLPAPSAADHAAVVSAPTPDAARNPLMSQTALGSEKQARRRSDGTGGASVAANQDELVAFWLERCELCGVESMSVESYEDVDVCASCLSQIRRDDSLGWVSA